MRCTLNGLSAPFWEWAQAHSRQAFPFATLREPSHASLSPLGQLTHSLLQPIVAYSGFLYLARTQRRKKLRKTKTKTRGISLSSTNAFASLRSVPMALVWNYPASLPAKKSARSFGNVRKASTPSRQSPSPFSKGVQCSCFASPL